ncbi:MAG: transglycosylase SLT domain-containing protein [Actinomycetota bacterium]|nr:transglycosylase SLT domain-containing protein [Actinomycetota bacterium]MDQ3721170.1 transglycosylase SLT domain-containing protein [Actinomycetota bacterium]
MRAPCRLGAQERGQSSVLMLGLAGALLAGFLVLASFGQALGSKGRHQRGADLAAVSAARAMRDVYPRLFESAVLEDGAPNSRHLSEAAYRDLARSTAVRAARANGLALNGADVGFPGATFAPTRVSVVVRGSQRVRVKGSGRGAVRRLAVRARAEAELSPAGPAGMPAMADGGGYKGPLAYRNGKPMRPDVARAFDRMAAAARRESGLTLTVTSGFRSDAEQARLFAANPDPKWVAPPGRSLHRLGTELDLGPPSAYGWLAGNSRRFGFVKRYAWEPWHFGYTRNAGSSSVGFGRPRGGGDGRGAGALPAFVPARYRAAILRASQRYNVGAALLAAQIYAESGFNPFARSPAGAQGIAQFMPGTARAYGLRNPFDAEAAIEAQARLMRDNLRRFGSVPLALAAYNAGPGAVARCMCIPPYPETRAYVAKILGLLGGAGDAAPPAFEVRLVE